MNPILKDILVVLAAFIAAMSPQIKIWIEDFNNRDKDTFADNLVIREKIRRILVRIRSVSGANRVSILEYHNSQYSLSGLPFDFCSMTYEDTDDKTKELITTFQKFPISPAAEMLLRLNDSKIGHTKDSSTSNDISISQVIRSWGTTTAINFRLGNNVKEGVLCLSWSDIDADLTDEQYLQIKSEILSININLEKIKKNT